MKTDEVIQKSIDWAMEHLGSTEYCHLCLKFVEDAIEQSSGIEVFGCSSAKETADLYHAKSRGGNPPVGAYVFYDCSGPIQGVIKHWGHVGLCIGEGKVIHAWGKVRIDPYLAIEQLEPGEGWTSPVYIGWAPIERAMLPFAASTPSV